MIDKRPLRLIVTLTDFYDGRTAIYDVDRDKWPDSLHRALEEAGALMKMGVVPDPVGDLIQEIEDGELSEISEDRARAEGFMDMLHGKKREDNPHNPQSPIGLAWLKGWDNAKGLERINWEEGEAS